MQMRNKILLIIYHSRTGTSKAAAEQARQAALACLQELDQSHTVILKPSQEASAADMLQADSYLFCAPENLAALSGAMKEFFDRLYYELLDKIEGRHFSAVIAAGSDGAMALKQLRRICTGWRLNEKVPAIIVNTASQTPEQIMAPKQLTEDQKRQIGELAATLAAWL